MKKVKFEYCFGDNYTIEAENMIADDGEGLRDFSGEYVKAEIAEELLAALKDIVAPGGRENVMRIAMPVIEKYDDPANCIVDDTSDICGLCGQPGANKIPHPEHWPGERIPDSEFVHVECEDEECRRAHSCLTPKQRQSTLDSIAGRYY